MLQHPARKANVSRRALTASESACVNPDLRIEIKCLP